MNEDELINFIVQGFEGVETTTANGDTFFFFGADHKFPFATLVTNDNYDSVSDLSRPGVFRLNIGVSKQTYQALFGAQKLQAKHESPPNTAQPDATNEANQHAEPEQSYDFSVLDTLMPHPVYGRQYWLCVLSPSQTTFETQVRPLLAEAYGRAAGKRSKHSEQT